MRSTLRTRPAIVAALVCLGLALQLAHLALHVGGHYHADGDGVAWHSPAHDAGVFRSAAHEHDGAHDHGEAPPVGPHDAPHSVAEHLDDLSWIAPQRAFLPVGAVDDPDSPWLDPPDRAPRCVAPSPDPRPPRPPPRAAAAPRGPPAVV